MTPQRGRMLMLEFREGLEDSNESAEWDNVDARVRGRFGRLK
jgi:hypothetical protein